MIVDEQIEALESDDFSKGNHQIVKFKEMVRMLLFNNRILTTDNQTKIYTDGHAKFDALLSDIKMQKIIYIFNTIFSKVMN